MNLRWLALALASCTFGAALASFSSSRNFLYQRPPCQILDISCPKSVPHRTALCTGQSCGEGGEEKNTASPTISTIASTTPVVHAQPPLSVRALYMTSWVAGTPSLRAHILRLLDSTELNAVVIDIKDATGRLSFNLNDPVAQSLGAVENRVPDMPSLITLLHQKHVYVIGRIAVFEDAYLPTIKPAWALRRKSNGQVWRDRKGIMWLDQSNHEVWNYIERIAKASYAAGFDELNFDYIRFPSDGDIADIDYGANAHLAKTVVLENFFRSLHDSMAQSGAALSVDVFGQITSATDDMGIGQSIEGVAPYFDYIDPMVYPSHYYAGFLNYQNPAAHPYQVVKYALLSGSLKLARASSTPAKLRPWLQDFSLATDYTPAMVRDQVKATYDAGLTSWMLWDPANHYSAAALLAK